MWPALNIIISKHIDCSEPVVIEGDAVIPSILKTRNLDLIEAVFLYDEPENLLRRSAERNRGPMLNVKKSAEFSYAFGEKIRVEAERAGFTTIKASPEETLFDRTLGAIST